MTLCYLVRPKICTFCDKRHCFLAISVSRIIINNCYCYISHSKTTVRTWVFSSQQRDDGCQTIILKTYDVCRRVALSSPDIYKCTMSAQWFHTELYLSSLDWYKDEIIHSVTGLLIQPNNMLLTISWTCTTCTADHVTSITHLLSHVQRN